MEKNSLDDRMEPESDSVFVFFDPLKPSGRLGMQHGMPNLYILSRALEYLELSDISRSDIYRSRIQMA